MEQFGEEAGGFKFGKQRLRSLGDPQGKLPGRGATTWFVSSPGLWAQGLHLGRRGLQFVIDGGGG